MRKTKKQRFRASILAFLLIASMVLGMVPGSAGQVYAKESTSQTSSEEEPGFIDKAVGFFKDTGEKIASFFGAEDEASPAAAYDTKKEVDTDTLQTWQPLAKNTTENIGRIWTDKTVSTEDMEFEGTNHKGEIGDSQFLVALSALSSTSNTVTTSSKPLDIVLVLDVSGSMSDPLGYVYNATYYVHTNGWFTYYAKNEDGTYTEIERITNRRDEFNHWEFNGKEVNPKRSANDDTTGRIQFYTRYEDSSAGSKMEALKTAANNFLTETAKQNDSISDPNKRHEISVVKFAGTSSTSYGNDTYFDNEYEHTYNHSQRLNPLTAYTSQTITSLTNSVSSINEAGATSADYGMQLAQSELNANGRQDAQKVIIFFTDGEPNHQNGFDSNVANDAISASKALKDKKAIVYSIGVFADADPGNTSISQSNRFNAYMHGISSNYPAATAWNSLGTAAEERKYYKAASDADQLNQIFEDILTDVNTGSGFPTEITQGYEPNKGGYVTFDDQLGAYMQVDAFKSILFADRKFDLDPDRGVQTEGNVTTYTFEGEGGNDLYPNGNLHDIIITVTKSDDLAVGDQVKVQIPASMIPLRHFSVDTNADRETTMEVKEAWPIRILYGASMKPGVAETLQDGLDDSAVDQALEAYLEANQTKINGKAAAFFYSNLYTGKSWVGHDGQTLGDTIASFDPAKGNTFYYFTKDTPIYTDENFAQPVKGQPVSGDTYYYKKVFWSLEEGQPVKETVASPFASDNFEQASANWGVNEQGEVYIKAGSAKLTRVDSLTLSKEQNTTNTATEVINPQWDNVNNPQTLRVYLGNNGRVAMEVPGALEITKAATVATDKNLNEQEIVKDKKFTFNISIPEMKDKTVKAEKRNRQGDIQGDAFDLSFDGEGKATAVLKDKETLYIHGLDAGVAYTVKEDIDSMAKGFALTSVDGEQKAEATGTIEAGVPKSHTFTNTYDVTETAVEAFAPFEKVFDRWDLANSFKMMLTPDNATYPMPEGTQDGQKIVEATKEKPAGNFGKITFTTPGTYGYTIVENVEEADKVLGVDYSMASYDVQVVVEDNGDGTLKVASVAIKQMGKDDGTPIPEEDQSTVEKAVFTNTYSAESSSLAAIVSKEYTDTAGGSLKNGQFQFKMTPRTDMDEINNPDTPNNRPTLPDGVTPDPSDRSITVGNTGPLANFGMATYGQGCVGNTYAYELTEVVPDPAQNGMTYDLSRYLVKMAVSSQEGADGGATVVVTPTYYKIEGADGQEQLVPIEERIPVFHNVYAPEDLVIPSEGNEAIHGSKTLEGRNSLDGESFTFTLTAANEEAQTALANDWIVFENDAKKADMTAAVTGIEKGIPAGFDFGEVKITRPGRYQFNVVENAPANGNGMVYDRHTALVTITVKDNNGKLEGTVVYNNGQGAPTTEAAFTNTYTASTIYGDGAALNLSKTLNGRNQALGEFKFQIQGQDEAAEKKLANTDREFATVAQANDGVASIIFDKMSGVRFTEADAGMTFSYVVKEVLPEDDDAEVEGIQSKGVTYTQTQYRVDIQVNDNGDGTMSTVTTVSRTHDDTGAPLTQEEVLGTYNSKGGKNDISDISFVNSYAADGTLNGAANLAGTKKMDGPWKATGKDLSGFQFTITGGDEATNTAIIAGTVVLPTEKTVTSDATGKFNFDDITFNKKGTYKFTVSEVVPAEEDKILGVTYNAAPATITVNVTDNDNGTLTATLAENSPELTFTNTYATTQDATFIPSVVKKVEGLDAKENFTFKLSAADDATKQAIDNKTITGIGTMADPYSAEKTTLTLIQKGKTEQVDFNALTFKKAGTYKFTVKETNTNVPTGWTYDSHTYKITINVTDVASVLTAQMEVTNPIINSQIFTNSFAATTTYGEEGGLNVTKTLDGRTLAADMFEFTITGVATDTVAAEEANAKLAETDTDKNFKNTAPGEDGVAVMSKLGAVQFDETDIGKTYQYAVQEIAGTDTKYTYDNVSATVAIQVLENNGELYTVTTVTKGEDVQKYSSINESKTAVVPFVNSYTPDIVTVEPGTFAEPVTKVLKGNRGAELAAGEFNFQMTITPADETSSMDHVVLPEGASDGTVTAANAVNGLVSFGNIQFKAAGKYHVAISEVIPEPADPNMTYDKHTFSYDIAVTYNAAEGTLSASVVEGSIKGSETFTNIYEADDAKDVANTKEPTTSVNGKIVGVGDQLTYTIDWVNNAVDETGAPAKAEVTITDEVPAGTKYVSADNEGAYDQDTNTITWTLGEQEVGASGTVSFVVEVLDIAGGTDVTNKAEITVGDNNPKQTNEVTTKVPGKDSVVEGDGELQVGKILTYTISYKNPEEEAATVTIKDIIPEGLDYVDGSAGKFASYNAETRTLTWKIADVQPGAEGTVTFNARVNESAETVVENKAEIQIGGNDPTYSTDTDQKEIPKDGNLSISKTIALTEGLDTEINKKQTFTFTVALKDAKGVALTKEYAYTVTGESGEEIKKGNATDGTEISFQHGQKAVITGLPAGAQYTVTETAVAGYTTSVNGQAGNEASGTIAADATAAADFTNTYSVAGSLSGSDALTVIKELVGREWLDTDRFAYALTPADEATETAVNDGFITLPANAGSLEIKKESAEHQAAFGDIRFTIAGTFEFHVTEQPSDIAGITDDENAERTVVVKVTDKKDGTLDAVVVKDKSDNLTFTNTYGAGTGEDDIAAHIPATKKLTGRDMKEKEFQFEVVTRKADEKAKNFKEELVATGTNVAARAGEAGTVTFAGKDEKLTYTVESLNKAVKAGYAVKEVKEGQSVWTVSYTARELTDKLPGGVKAVEGKTSYDFTIVVTDNNNGTLTAQVQALDGGIAFENAYTTGGTEVDTEPTDAAAYFNKKLVGRDWLDTDEFTFTITPKDGAPAPAKTTATVKKADAKEGDLVPFGFGKITFTDANMAGATVNEDGTLSKTFTYQITENDVNAETMPGVTKDNHVATLTITVTDNQQGELSASANMTAENGTFTNTYESSLDYTALSGLQITKVLKGRDMADGQFTFTVTPEDKASADKLELAEGATEFKNTAKPAGETDTMDVLAGKNVTFTQEDAGKTFTYTVAEKEGNNSAYNYDTVVRTVTIEVADNTDSTLTVTTRVMKDGQVVDEQIVKTADEGQKKATVAFVNTYNDNPTTLGGEGNVKINATKSLTNRPMVDGEFTFHVLDKNQNLVTSGTNSADGTITFDPVTYDTDNLIADEKAGIAKKSVQEGAYVYTYNYKVVEAPTTDGVTGDATTFAIQVIVTDKGDGTLELKVQYPEGTDSLAFKNLYGEGAEAEITINGHKQYEVASGDNEPDITGKYTFTITGSEGAPMPKQTKVTNDYAGNVEFGAITYTMENVFGDTGSKAEVAEAAEGAAEDEAEDEVEGTAEAKSAKREKTFTYTVAESGSVPGVQNDGSSKTFTVKVTDNGNGTIAVEKSWKENEFPFSFTNTYSVDPVDYSINTDLTITKELDGRELKEGEFTFELVGEDKKVVSTAQNSADGSVTFGALTYKVPGTYNYVIREQKGSAGGVEYDSAEHTVVVVVTDNGDGTMTAKAELKSRDDEDAKNAIVFKNSYTAQPASVTLGASKAYTGGKLGDGQFTFELRDESDKLISKAKNNENGQIVFETIEYKNVGTYKYKISEVNDEQKHVTYDKTVYGVTVTVTDNQEGSLMAAVEYDGGKAPVFTNKYSKPAKPAKPEEPKGPTAVKTGDEAPVIPFIILMVATLAIIVTITFIFFRRKRR